MSGEGGSGRRGGQVGCERRIEVFVKIQKKKIFGGGGGVRVDVNEELMFLRKFTKGGQGGCERRIEVFGKDKKKTTFFLGGVGLGWM